LKSVLIFKLSPLHSAPRVQRTYKAIHEHYSITTAGLSAIGAEKENFIDLTDCLSIKESEIDFHLKFPAPIRKIFSFFIKVFLQQGYSKSAYLENKYWTRAHKAILQKLNTRKYDIVIAHGVDALPIGYELAKRHNAKLVFNAHEYYPREFEENPNWVLYNQPLNTYLCEKYLSKTDLIFSVTDGISKEYKKVFNVNPITITNAAPYYNMIPNENYLKIRIIHHGVALRSRRIHEMIECAKLLDNRFEVDFMLVEQDKEYYEELGKMIKMNSNIRLIKPVKYNEIVSFINKYHIGFYILPKSNFNNEMALPNKFFEFIQARLMLAISPNQEMANIVEQFNIGVVADDYSYQSMAKAINSLTIENIKAYQRNTIKCANEMNAETNAKVILNSINSLN